MGNLTPGDGPIAAGSVNDVTLWVTSLVLLMTSQDDLGDVTACEEVAPRERYARERIKYNFNVLFDDELLCRLNIGV